jgi:hypothetical protein
MRTTIADLWLLTPDDRFPDMRGPPFNARQIEHEIQCANDECRDAGRTGRPSSSRKPF